MYISEMFVSNFFISA